MKIVRGGLYFVRAGAAGRPIKIGVAEDIDFRISRLQVGSPDELKLLHIMNRASFRAEAALHERFAAERVRGEWFSGAPRGAVRRFLDRVMRVDQVLRVVHNDELIRCPWCETTHRHDTRWQLEPVPEVLPVTCDWHSESRIHLVRPSATLHRPGDES